MKKYVILEHLAGKWLAILMKVIDAENSEKKIVFSGTRGDTVAYVKKEFPDVPVYGAIFRWGLHNDTVGL